VSINSVSSSSLASALQVRQQPEAKEATNQAGRDAQVDGDSDDGTKASVAAATKPSVNSSGQAIGTIISTTA